MATRNPFGTVALGQEGSGLAQILTPYDSAKYDNAIIEQEQTNRKEEAKALQEEVKTLKAPELVDPKINWTADDKRYSEELDKLYDNEKLLFEQFVDLSNSIPKSGQDPTEWRSKKREYELSQIEHNRKTKAWNQKIELESQNREDYEYASEYSVNNADKVNPTKQKIILNNFLDPPKEIVDKFDGNVEKARAYYRDEIMGGRDGLVALQFNWGEHNKRIKDATATTAKKLAGGNVVFNEEKGGWIDTQTNNLIYDKKQMRDITLSSIASEPRALLYFRDEEPVLDKPLKDYAKTKNKSKENLTTKEVLEFISSDDPVAIDYLQSRYYWNNSSETSISFQQANDGYGAGGVHVDKDGKPVATRVSDIQNDMPLGFGKLFNAVGMGTNNEKSQTYIYGASEIPTNDLTVSSNATTSMYADDYIIDNETGKVIDPASVTALRGGKETTKPVQFGANRITWGGDDLTKLIEYKDEYGNLHEVTYTKNEPVDESIANIYKNGGEILTQGVNIKFEPVVSRIADFNGKLYTVITPLEKYHNLTTAAANKYSTQWENYNPYNNTQSSGSSGIKWEKPNK